MNACLSLVWLKRRHPIPCWEPSVQPCGQTALVVVAVAASSSRTASTVAIKVAKQELSKTVLLYSLSLILGKDA